MATSMIGQPARPVNRHAPEQTPRRGPEQGERILQQLASRQTTISVVIPALNEAENLPHVLPHIPAGVHEVILVDGHSEDATVEVARALRPDIRIVTQLGRGKGAALRTGFAAATGDIIVMLDADGSTDPREIPAFVGTLLAGADFVKGSRFLQGGGTADMPVYRQLGNGGLTLAVRLLFGGNFSDLCYGYNAFWRRVLPRLSLDGDGFEIETMMNVRALRAGLKVAEVPSFEAERVHGVGRLRALPDGWRVVKTIVRERLRPAHSYRLPAAPDDTLELPAFGSQPAAPDDDTLELPAFGSQPAAPAEPEEGYERAVGEPQ